MAAPNRRHQEILLELAGIIRDYTKSKDGSYKPYISPFSVFLNEDDKTYVEHDKNRITIHDLEHEDVNEYTFSDSVKAGIYEDLSIDFGQLNI